MRRPAYDLGVMLAFEPWDVRSARLALENCPRRHLLTRLRLWWELRRLRKFYDWVGK